ncbi:MAG TPA: amidase [Acidimicrobiales bacterium]
MPDALAWADACALAELVRTKQVSPLELVDAAIARIEQLDPTLNAVIHRRFERAREDAMGELPDGPFRGVPFLVKDALCTTASDPFHAGTRFLKAASWCAPADTELAARYRRAGFVFVGRTNTPEFATSATTEPLAYGPTRNPWDTERSPGGSSGGSGAAVAAGYVPAAHGNDMGGSIRIPSGWCGLVGLKPSRGRNTLAPAHGEYWATLTHEHVLTRTVRDSAAILDVTAGPALGDPYTAPPPARPFAAEVGAPVEPLRVAFRTHRPDNGAESHPEVVRAVHDTAALLGELGHHVEADPLPGLDGWDGLAGMSGVIAAWVAYEVDLWGERLGRELALDELEPANAAMVERARSMTAVEYVKTIELMNEYSRRAASWSERFDLLLLPTAPWPAPPLGVLGPKVVEDHPEFERRGPAVFTLPFDITGEPAMSLPMHWTADGLPVGVQLVAPYGREDVLFRVAAMLEQAHPWADRHPAIAAW